MALNPQIFSGNALKSPEEYAAERENLLATRQTNALNAQKMDEYRAGVAEKSALGNLLAQPGFNVMSPESQAQVYKAAPRSGASFLKGIIDNQEGLTKIGKEQALTDSAKASAAKDTNDTNLKTWQSFRDQAGMVNDLPSAQAYLTNGYHDPVIGPYLQRMGTLEEGLKRIPQDPVGFEAWRNGLGMKVDQLAAHALQQQQLGATIRGQDLSAATQRRGQDITMRGQNMSDARAREGNALKAAEIQAGGKPPPGYRWNSDGTLEAIPGGPGDKLPEAQQKQVVGVQNLSNAIQEYRQALKSFGSLDALKPDQRAMMGTKYNNMMLQAKEAYNLGVLNGPDFDILQSVVTDPRSIKGVITSNKALDTQAAELDRIMSGVAQTSSQLKPRGGTTQPSNQGPKAGDVDGGYRFKGGDPSNPSNWEKVK